MREHGRHAATRVTAAGATFSTSGQTGPATAADRASAASSVKPRLVDDVWFRIGVAVGAVGALLLVAHLFEPFLMLGALPTKAWRAAAYVPVAVLPQDRNGG